MKEFAVTSTNYETYMKFKSSLEKIGYMYSNNLILYGGNKTLIMEKCNCFYIATGWGQGEDYFGFQFSNTYDQTYNIDHEETFKNALKYAKKYYNSYHKTNVSLKEIAEWKGCNVNAIQIIR